MKFTNKGRQIKDNSRRTGVGAARVAARQQGALNRFQIMGMIQWSKAHGGMGHVDHARPLYDAYVARRNVELDSLKRSLKVA